MNYSATRQNGRIEQDQIKTDWIRFALYASDGQYAEDFFQNIADSLKNNSDRLQYLTSVDLSEGTILSGNTLSVLKRGRDKTSRIAPRAFNVQKRSETSLSAERAGGKQTLNQKTRTGYDNGYGNGNASAELDEEVNLLGVSDLIDIENQKNAYEQWIANPKANAFAIRVSVNLSQTPANRLPEEAQRMIALVKLAHRSQVSFLNEEITPAVFNHTNYQESLKPKMVLTRTKTLEQIRSEIVKKNNSNTFFLDPAGNLKPVRNQKDWEALFFGNGSPLKVGQDQQGEYLLSTTSQGSLFRVRLIETNPVSDEIALPSDGTSVRSQPVILVEMFSEE